MPASSGTGATPASWLTNLCGVTVHFKGRDAAGLSQLEDLWRSAIVTRPASLTGRSRAQSAAVEVHFDARLRAPRTSAPEVELSPSSAVRHSRSTSWLYSRHAAFAIRGHSAALRFSPRFRDVPLLEQQEFILNAAVMLLQRADRFGLHASAVVKGGVGVLAVAHSGSGKTSTALALISQGWSYLSDDLIALELTGGQVRAHAVRTGVSWTKTTRSKFPALHPDDDRWTPAARGKWMARPGGGARDSLTYECAPRLLLFPEVAHAPASRLEPVSDAEAVINLMHQSSGLLVRPETSKRQINVLGRLIAQCKSYRFLAGRDVYEDPAAVSDLLLKAQSAGNA